MTYDKALAPNQNRGPRRASTSGAVLLSCLHRVVENGYISPEPMLLSSDFHKARTRGRATDDSVDEHETPHLLDWGDGERRGH